MPRPLLDLKHERSALAAGEANAFAAGLQLQHRRWRSRHPEGCALQVFFKPQILGDGVLARVTVVQVRGDAEARAGIGQAAPVPSHVVEVPVKVIGGREPENRAGDEREVGVVGNAGQLQGRALGSAPAGHHSLVLQKVARPAARRHGGFDALVDPREVGRELASHGMPVRSDARRVHFGLLFQESDGAAGRHQHEKPIAVPRRLDRVERVFVRRE